MNVVFNYQKIWNKAMIKKINKEIKWDHFINNESV